MLRAESIGWVLLLLALMGPPPVKGQAHEGLRDLAERYWNARMARYPEKATALGDYRFNDRLFDPSDGARQAWRQELQALARAARGIRTAELSPTDRLTKDLLVRAIQDELLQIELRGWNMPLNPLDGPQVELPLMVVSHPFRSAKDFKDYQARLRAIPRHLHEHMKNIRDGMARGLVSSRTVVEKTIPQIEAQLVRDASRSVFHQPLKDARRILGDEADPLVSEISHSIETEVAPSFWRLLAFVEDEYLTACREDAGIGSIPAGAKLYEQLVRLHTTVPMSAEGIHRIGLEEVARIRSEMAKVQETTGFEGSLDAFLEHMRSEPKYRFASPDEMVARADEILQRTKPHLDKLFRRLPRAQCVMKEIEPFRAAAAPVAYYQAPPEDGSRPGYYYLNTYAPHERLRFTLEALTYHEAVPGHHLQIALHQEQSSLPRFRRYGEYTAFIEGWALYTEKLGYLIEGYRTPQDRFGQLTLEMWRACRLVVDTGIHAKGWTRKQAIEFMERNSSLARLDIETEVDRYTAWPGQALAYKIGELRILALKEEAEKTLGDRFELRDFHDALLAEGPLPLDMLEAHMRAWMSSY